MAVYRWDAEQNTWVIDPTEEAKLFGLENTEQTK